MIYLSYEIVQIITQLTKNSITFFHNFFVSFFSFSDNHQFHYFDGCHAIGDNSYLVQIFSAF